MVSTCFPGDGAVLWTQPYLMHCEAVPYELPFYRRFPPTCCALPHAGSVATLALHLM